MDDPTAAPRHGQVQHDLAGDHLQIEATLDAAADGGHGPRHLLSLWALRQPGLLVVHIVRRGLARGIEGDPLWHAHGGPRADNALTVSAGPRSSLSPADQQ